MPTRSVGVSGDQESILLDYVERLDRYREGRRAVHIHMSRLSPQNRRDTYMRIAASIFDTAIIKYDGALFRMANGDYVFLAKGATVSDLDDIVLRLRFLFSDDLVAKGESNDGDVFCTWFDLVHDYTALLTLARRFVAERRRAEAETGAAMAAPAPGTPASSHQLDAKGLAEIERVLSTADLSGMLRHQCPCRHLQAAGRRAAGL
jgi:hypothetical protein